MLKNCVRYFSITCCAGLLLVFCNSAGPTKATNVSQVKILDSDISGWAINSSGVFYSADSWAASGVDGEAYGFSSTNPYSEVLDEHMNGPNGAAVTMYVINYSADAQALEQFNLTKTQYSGSPESLLPFFPDDVAAGDNSHSAIYAFAHFNQFYIELRFSGYTEFSLSKTDAITFLQLIEAKVNGE